MLKNHIVFSLILSVFLILTACKSTEKQIKSTHHSTTVTHKKPKNIILMIGDGMGLTQITAGLFMNNNHLNLEQFPIVGLHKSYSCDDLITDSAAGATAFSTGKKTYNLAIGVGCDSMPLETILEWAEKRDMPTGLVATCTVVHATPASFIAHVKKRDSYEEIAADFIKTDCDYIVGGGKNYFTKRKNDERNIVEEFKKKGYQYSDFVEDDIFKIQPDPSKNFLFFTANDHPLPVSSGRDYLPFVSEQCARFLDKKAKNKGFFAMIEGSQIDWGGHANNSEYIYTEMIDFDKAIGKVLEFAKQDGETLVIVTADHETGGYSLVTGSKMGNLIAKFTTDKHTPDLIPVFAFGPGAELFSGIYENTAIYDKMKKLLQ